MKDMKFKLIAMALLSFFLVSCGRIGGDNESKSDYFREARDTSKNSLTYYFTSTQFSFNFCQLNEPVISSLNINPIADRGIGKFHSSQDKTMFYWLILKRYKNVKLPYTEGRHVIAFHYSGGENFLYNWNYIVNLPQKIIHTIQIDTKLGDRNFIVSLFANLFYGLWGALIALIMMFIGTITGTIFHPIDTILTLIPNIFQLIMDTLHAIYMLFIGYV